ncbi:acyl-CoA dehydrogenase [Streptacidiphilus anmyonensis]|uniref:acyl-CoA dehydrogenase n=1 Tax=Streptacidiphilus anmyonensis TaxID=405782 RepID=UPI000A05A8A2|nr:acyl-CoA dehydrogenase [Streptacidiphilus anmyonensis]
MLSRLNDTPCSGDPAEGPHGAGTTHGQAGATPDHGGVGLDAGERQIRERVAAFEELLGDPHEAGNPFGNAALLEADERGELSVEAERALAAFRLNDEFVPRELGGNLDRIDGLARVLRPLFRRDASLGLGYGVTSFLAAIAVWAAGDEAQRGRTADLLRGGGRLAIAYHELAHGNDFVRNEFSARPDGSGGYLLDGRKDVINNAGRAEGLVLFCLTAPPGQRGPRSHSVLLVDTAGLPEDAWRVTDRYRTVGVRGCQVAGFSFERCRVPADALVGRQGGGVETALRSFQITRSVVPGMVLGGADTALRTVVRFATSRELYRRSVLDIPHAQATVASAFTDLLVCDSICLAATRAVHLLPEQTSVYAAAVKYLVPKLLQDACYNLSIVLGANFYVRDGDYGVFQKHVRDLPMVSLGHAGSAACQATIIPQLPRLARRSWTQGTPAPEALFRTGGGLPALDTDRLVLAAEDDALVASLLAAADRLEGPREAGAELAPVRALVRALVAELTRVREECLALGPHDRTAMASPHAYALADRYTLLLAGSACVNVWLAQRQDGGDFLADPRWVVAALTRVCRHLGLPLPEEADEHSEWMLAEVLGRYHEGRSFDLYDTHLAGPLVDDEPAAARH